MRGADGGPWNRICALPALWVGLLYDQGALDAAWDLVRAAGTWKGARRCAAKSPASALTRLCPAVAPCAISRAKCWPSRARASTPAPTPTPRAITKAATAPLDEIVASGKVPAQRLLDKFHGEWGGDIRRVYERELLMMACIRFGYGPALRAYLCQGGDSQTSSG